MHSLDKLFKPRSIAVLGASTNENKVGSQMLHSLRRFPGPLFPVNPKARFIQGLKAYPNIKSINDPVDLVIFNIPAGSCLKAMQEAGEAGVGAVMIVGGGFGETGDEGKKLQDDLVAIAGRYGIRLLGPNTAGFGNPRLGVTANIVPWINRLTPGPVAVVSQSGSMNLILASNICDSRLGISLGVGVGNAADVGIPEILDYLSDDPETKAIVLYLEGVSDGRQLYEAVYRATKKKPVIAFAVGKAPDIGEFATSHTGNLIGSFTLKTTALRQAGAVCVSTSNELIVAAKMLALARLNPNPDPGVGLLAGQAGPALIFTDYLRCKSVKMPELQPETIERLSRVIPPITYIKNPVDTARPDHEMFSNALAIVSEDPGIDLVVTFALHEPAAVDPVVAHRYLKYKVNKPMIFGTSGFLDYLLPILQDLEMLGVPAFVSPDRTAQAVWALVEDAKISYHKNNRTRTLETLPHIPPIKPGQDEAQSKEILNAVNIPVPAGTACDTHKEVKEAFSRLKKPCVLKVLGAEITHKTEHGGVILDIRTEEQLVSALSQIDKIDFNGNRRYLLEELSDPGLEIIIGAKNDRSFGPTVLVGLGGTAAEAIGDVSMRLAPLTREDAMEMIYELKSCVLFDAWRGGPRYDKDAVADTLVRVGQLMEQHREILEMDLNPVRVFPKGLMVLDALIVCR
ncbi:MAG: acetate--CoA ligase family protein [Deltaproteobacteria bacterium]|nr:acetate--CoA ligase family protein [Deltaproteobacteria bacterium]